MTPSCPGAPDPSLPIPPGSAQGLRGAGLLSMGLHWSWILVCQELISEPPAPGLGHVGFSWIWLILDSRVSAPGLMFWAWIALGVIEVSLKPEFYKIQGKAPQTGEVMEEKLLGSSQGALAMFSQAQGDLLALRAGRTLTLAFQQEPSPVPQPISSLGSLSWIPWGSLGTSSIPNGSSGAPWTPPASQWELWGALEFSRIPMGALGSEWPLPQQRLTQLCRGEGGVDYFQIFA